MDAMTQSNIQNPSLADVFGSNAFGAAQQALANMGTNQAFNQQNFQNNQNNLDAKTLENLYTAQNAPTKLNQGVADLTKTILGNQGTALTNSENQQTSDSRVKASIAKSALDLSDAHLDELSNHIQEGMLQDLKNGQLAQANEKLGWMKYLSTTRAARAANDQRERDIAAAQNATRLAETGMQTATQRETNAATNATSIINNQNTVEGRMYAADLNQKLDNRILQLQKIGTPEALAAANELVRTKQITGQYGSQVSLPSLSNPNAPLGRGADVNNAPFGNKLSDEDLLKKYSK